MNDVTRSRFTTPAAGKLVARNSRIGLENGASRSRRRPLVFEVDDLIRNITGLKATGAAEKTEIKALHLDPVRVDGGAFRKR